MPIRPRLQTIKSRLGTIDQRAKTILPPMTTAEADAHRRTQYDKARAGDPIRKLYATPRWQALRVSLYVERGARCECGCGRLTVLYQREANEFTPVAVFDHVEGARERPDLFWSKEHIKLLAKPCHDRITVLRDGGFGNIKHRKQ